MPGGRLNLVWRYIHRLAGPPAADGPSDGELLRRFVTVRDQGAFTQLTERHGSLVLGVCRRVLNDPHAVEDAFQATFLVLVRKARSLVGQASLAGWLYTVAYHTALKVRARAARQRAVELQAARITRTDTAEITWSDLRPVIDQELSRLPEKYRVPVVLCYLEGKTNDEAAAQLGWSRGTIAAGRLARARDLLRTRLAHRGLALSAGGLGATLAQGPASAAVPANLAQTTGTAAVLLASGKGLAEATSVPVAAMVEGMLRGFWLSQLKTAGAALVLLTAVGLGAGTLLPRGPTTVYLADLAEVRLNVPSPSREYFFAGGTVKGLESPHNLSLHPPTGGYSSVTYKLGGAYRSLRTAAGIRDNPEGGSRLPLTFMVLGDGQLLWKSPPVQANGKTEECQVSVQGVDLLELQVHCPGARWNAWAAWVEPQLLR